MRSWVSHEYPERKPWFTSVRVLFFSKWFSMLRQIMCSRSLEITGVSEIGL